MDRKEHRRQRPDHRRLDRRVRHYTRFVDVWDAVDHLVAEGEATDDELPGSPIEALRANRGTEVKRRAQALGF